jgi:hypothetical protein
MSRSARPFCQGDLAEIGRSRMRIARARRMRPPAGGRLFGRLGLLCGLSRPAVMTGYLLRTTYPGYQKLALDLPRYSEDPLLGTPSSVLIMSDLSLKRRYSIFGSEKLQRKLVSDIQTALMRTAGIPPRIHMRG